MFQKVGAALRDNRKAAAFLSGQAVSLFGSSLVQYALMWHVVLETDSGTMMGIFTLFILAPQIPMSLFGGVMADRYNRKLLIMLADSGIALATLVLCILMLLGHHGFVLLLIVAAIRSLGSGIQSPAVSAILPQLTEPDKLMRVNSINATIQSLVMLLSPAAAAYVYAEFSLPGILMIDVVTAMIGVSIMASIHVATHERKNDSQNSHVLTDLKTGLKYAANSTFIKRMTFYYAISSFLIVPAATFTPLFVGRVYGSDPFFLKYNEIIFFMGSVLGGIIISYWGGFKNRVGTMVLGALVFGVATTFMGLAPTFTVYLGLMVVAGLTTPTFQAPMMSLMQERIPIDMIGRVLSLMQICSSFIFMVAAMAVGLLSDSAPIGVVLSLSGALLALLGILMLLDKKFYKLGEPLPKSIT